MENKIPTAKEFWLQNNGQHQNTAKMMIEFTKLHVETQAKAIVNNINPEKGKYIISNKESILSLYNLDNIK